MIEVLQIEVSPNSRFSIHSNPNAAPGVCCVCKSAGGDGRWFIDFGFQLDVYGAVYFCSYCFTEGAKAVGYVPSLINVASINEKNHLQEKLDKMKKDREEYLGAVRVLFLDCKCDCNPSLARSRVYDEPNDSSSESETEPDDSEPD